MSLLTDARGCRQSLDNTRGLTSLVEQAGGVQSKGNGGDGLRRGSDDQQLDPQVEEADQRTEGFQDIGVLPATASNGRPQFTEAQGAEHGKDATKEPDTEGPIDGLARVVEHAFR